ncbi:MAG: hypothetical protein F4088_03455 [Chloroflexi bacterium]|nr:hypothetical protein [Chloroflexota bacterium]MXX49317.1 hypothetical protein [Chloroflexota bacterium]MYJ57937.1 hypothetical protein [Chloroflexota bacterium]
MSSFVVYPGLAGRVSQGWHRDCGTGGTLSAVDIGGDVGDRVYFRVRNTGQTPITYRYRYDCAGYPTGTRSGMMFMIDSTAGTYIIRYLHLNLDSGVSSSWSAAVSVPSGQTRIRSVGTLSAVSSKTGIKGYDTDEDNCDLMGGLTDVGGICSSGPHLHQASSNGQLNQCLQANLANNCSSGSRWSLPDLRDPLPASVSTSTVLFSK